jgi:hypothetical protein
MEKPIQTNKGTGQKEEQSAGLDQAMVKWTSAVAVFTGLLFLANAIGLFFIEEQWRIANRSQADLREQLRAVVSYDGITVIPANIKDGKPTAYAFITKFHNFGATRTYEFKAWVSVHYFDESVPNSQDFTKPWDKVDVNNAIVGPGADIFMAPLTVNPDYAAKAMNKEGSS